MRPMLIPATLVLALSGFGCGGTGGESGAARRVAIDVTEKGFEPAETKVKAGQPLTLVVTRTTENTCAREIVIADAGVRRELPLNQPVEIAFTPPKAGEVRYACGMDMITGRLVVD